ncbi:TerD family protein [Paenibacillus sp. P36]|uniref:TerD family protein n=1 Tax=Paenibacillus sp. P36 TaxID=3342538 RepID=UPI0038B30BC2
MLEYELENHFSIETAIVAGELYRYGAACKVSAIGSDSSDGYESGLQAVNTWENYRRVKKHGRFFSKFHQ